VLALTSLGRYSSLADSDHRGYFIEIQFVMACLRPCMQATRQYAVRYNTRAQEEGTNAAQRALRDLPRKLKITNRTEEDMLDDQEDDDRRVLETGQCSKSLLRSRE
jgi:hypothetical protein